MSWFLTCWFNANTGKANGRTGYQNRMICCLGVQFVVAFCDAVEKLLPKFVDDNNAILKLMLCKVDGEIVGLWWAQFLHGLLRIHR